MERTLIIVKPEGVQRGLIGETLRRFEAKGLKVVGLKFLRIPREQAERHYAEHQGKPFYEGLVTHITSSPVVVGALEGSEAVTVTRTLIGATNPRAAAPGTIRGDLGLEIGMNIVHGSDSVGSAERELAIFFAPEELVSYERAGDRWVVAG